MKTAIAGGVLVLSLLAFSQTSQAFEYTVDCPDVDTCHGNEYFVDITNVGGDIWKATISVTILNTYIGTPGADLFNAISIKNFAPSFSVASGGDALFSYSGPNTPPVIWEPSLFELNNGGGGGCGGPGGGDNELCIWAGSSEGGTTFAIGNTLTWMINLDLPDGINTTAELKFRYLEPNFVRVCTGTGQNRVCTSVADGTYDKVGSLGSFPIGSVPEPSSVALMGLGLILLGALGMRRRGKSFAAGRHPKALLPTR